MVEFMSKPHHSGRSITRGGVLLLMVALCAGVPAQRPYQRYWIEKEKEQKKNGTAAPAIIEDDLEPLDPASERYLFQGMDYPVYGGTVFESKGLGGVDPVSRLAFAEYGKAAYQFEGGSATKALKAFEDALKKDPENNWIRLRLAETCVMLNDLSRGRTLFEEVLKVDPENFRALLGIGDISVVQKDYVSAKQWYQKVLEVKPKNTRALEILTQLAFEVDRDLEKAKEYSGQILMVDGKNLNAMLWNAEASAQTGDISRAAELYVRLIRYRPSIVDRMTEIARRLAATDRLDDARLLYEKAMVAAPAQAELRRNWEQIVFKIGGEEAVRQAYERLVEESRQDFRIYDLYAEFLLRQNDWPRLVEFRKKTLEADPGNVAALLDLAMNELRQGAFENAEPLYDKAISANPADPEVYRRIADAYLSQERLDRAAELFNKAIVLNPKDILSMESLSVVEEKRGRVKEAEELLRKALDQSPANPELLKHLGALYLRNGDRRHAAELFQQVVTADRLDLSTWLALAQIYLEDENAAALDRLETDADNRLSEYPQFGEQYGRLAQDFGEYERSRRALERALKVVPADVGIRASLARAYVRLNLPDLAVKALNDADPFIKNSEELKLRKSALLANLQGELNRFDQAEKIWEGLIKSKPEELEFREQYLMTLVKAGKDAAVQKELNDVIRQFGAEKPLETQILRAEVFKAQGDAPRAVGVLKQLLADNPENHEVWFRLALAASEVNDINLAETYYRKLIDLGPADKNHYYETATNNLGYMFAQNKTRLDEAEKLVKQALEANPTAAYIMDSLGWVYFMKEDYQNARLYMEKAAKRAYRDAEIYTNLGQLYEKIGEKELARTSYDRALETDPAMKLARERRDALAITDKAQKLE